MLVRLLGYAVVVDMDDLQIRVGLLHPSISQLPWDGLSPERTHQHRQLFGVPAGSIDQMLVPFVQRHELPQDYP